MADRRQDREYTDALDDIAHTADSALPLYAFSEVSGGVLDRMLAARNGEVPYGLKTGLPSIDVRMRIQPGQLIVVAGRPGMGALTFGLGVVRETVFRNHGIGLVFSLESSRFEIAARIMSAETGIRGGDGMLDSLSGGSRHRGEVFEGAAQACGGVVRAVRA